MRQAIKLSSGEYLTADLIRDWAEDGSKIILIKALREVSGLGLKDSKDKVELAQKPKTIVSDPTRFDILKLIRIFEPYLPESERCNRDILKGVRCALTYHRKLGFLNPFDAARMVIDNYEKNGVT